MAPPKRLKITVGDFSISAAILPEFTPDNVEKVVCKACSPKRTTLTEMCSLIQHGFERDRCYTVVLCNKCQQQWAVPYYVLHSVEEAQ